MTTENIDLTENSLERLKQFIDLDGDSKDNIIFGIFTHYNLFHKCNANIKDLLTDIEHHGMKIKIDTCKSCELFLEPAICLKTGGDYTYPESFVCGSYKR